MLKILIPSVLGFFLLSSCSDLTNPTNITTKPIERSPLILPKPDPIVLRNTTWIIVTQDNVTEVLKDNKVIFALSATDYENLALNLNDIRSYIQEQTVIISAYEEYND